MIQRQVPFISRVKAVSAQVTNFRSRRQPMTAETIDRTVPATAPRDGTPELRGSTRVVFKQGLIGQEVAL
jgi:hypothetical protein